MAPLALAFLLALAPSDTTDTARDAPHVAPPVEGAGPRSAASGWPGPPPANLGFAAVAQAAVEAVEAQADTTERRLPLQFRPRIAPSALYSSNRGFGIGGGVGIKNAFWNGTDLVLDLRLQQRFQSANATFYTSDPYDSRFHLLLTGGGSTTERRRYYGLGPNTIPESEINLFHDAAQAEVRAGYYPLGTTALYIQPGVRFLYDYTTGVNAEAGAGSLDALDAKSREAVEVVTDENRYGASVGLELATDLRDWPSYPRRGFFGTVEHRRFVAFDDSDLTLARYAASGIGYLQVRGRTSIIVRGVGILTRSGDADGDGVDDPIPFYYLPTLDDRVATAFKQDRLTGRDVLAFGTGVRFPVIDAFGIYGLDMLVMGYLGNAYDNVFEQFRPAISFAQGSEVDDIGRTALRPSLALGVGLINLDKERVVLGGLLGVGPGGVTLATLRIAYDLRDARPLFR